MMHNLKSGVVCATLMLKKSPKIRVHTCTIASKFTIRLYTERKQIDYQ